MHSVPCCICCSLPNNAGPEWKQATIKNPCIEDRIRLEGDTSLESTNVSDTFVDWDDDEEGEAGIKKTPEEY